VGVAHGVGIVVGVSVGVGNDVTSAQAKIMIRTGGSRRYMGGRQWENLRQTGAAMG